MVVKEEKKKVDNNHCYYKHANLKHLYEWFFIKLIFFN